MRRKNLFLTTCACRHAQVFIRERYFVMACYDVDYEKSSYEVPSFLYEGTVFPFLLREHSLFSLA